MSETKGSLMSVLDAHLMENHADVVTLGYWAYLRLRFELFRAGLPFTDRKYLGAKVVPVFYSKYLIKYSRME